MNKFLIKQSLIDVEFCKVTKDAEKYGKSLVELTDEELQEKIEYYKNQGFQVATCHQEEFGDGWRFIRDGEGLDDIEGYMSKGTMNYFLFQCEEEIENIIKMEIQNGNLDQILSGKYSFMTYQRVYNILYKYAKRYGENIDTVIFMNLPLTLLSYVGNVSQTYEIIKKLAEQNIYINFYQHGYCTNILTLDEEEYEQYKQYDIGDTPEMEIKEDLEGWFCEFFVEETVKELLEKVLREGKITQEQYAECTSLLY